MVKTIRGVLVEKTLRKTAYTFYPTHRCREEGSFDLEKSDIIKKTFRGRVKCPGEDRLRDYWEIEVSDEVSPDDTEEE